tara:strand:- start:381 stop:581 length:201 start_codon:yes stop_codon:yes gene_type:complete
MGNVSEAYNEMMQGDAPANWVSPSIVYDVREILTRMTHANDVIFLIAGEGMSYTLSSMKFFEEISK